MATTNYYYGDGVTYQEGVGYTLTNARQYYWSDNYSELNHYYTCLQETDEVCEKVYFILSSSREDGYSGPSSSRAYYIEMTNSETYESLYSEAEKATWKFGNDVVYNAETSSYTLINPIEVGIFAFYNDSTEQDKANNGHHYTCFNNSNECLENIYYLYNTSYYITLNGGTKIEDAIKEMTSESTNENKSVILTKIDRWYEANLKETEYEKYIEDAIWCNDRSISSLGGWDKDADNIDYLYFGAYERNMSKYRPSLNCVNEVDRFSVGNPRAKLDYPVGLLTADEVTLAGGGSAGYSNKSYLYIGINQWILSPNNFDFYYARGIIYGSHLYTTNVVTSSHVVRPSIALEPGAIIIKGDGTVGAPFEITYNGV